MVAVVAFPLCMDVVEVTVVRMVQFLNKRQAYDDSLKWLIVPGGPHILRHYILKIH